MIKFAVVMPLTLLIIGCASSAENKEISIEDIFGPLSPKRTIAARAADNLLERLPIDQVKDCDSIYKLKKHTERKNPDYSKTRWKNLVFGMASMKWDFNNVESQLALSERVRKGQNSAEDLASYQLSASRAFSRYRRESNAKDILAELQVQVAECDGEAQKSLELVKNKVKSDHI